MSKYMIRNTFAVAAMIILIYLLTRFYSGIDIYDKIQGHWVCIENSDEYIFIENEYFHGNDSGVYRINGNKIIMDFGEEYFLNVKNEWLIINGVSYLKR